jgi:hypothetical protein
MDTQPLNKELIERDVANTDYYSSLAGLDNPVKEKETAIRSDLENDFYKLTYNQMVNKYGVDATNAIYQNFGNAGAQYIGDRTAERTWGQAALDTANSALGSAVTGIASVAALPSFIDPNLANKVYGGINQFEEDVFNKNLSDPLQRELRRLNAIQARNEKYNRLQQEKEEAASEELYRNEVQTKGKTLADLSKIGRDAGIWAKRIKEDALDATAVTMTSPMKLGHLGSGAVGSIGASLGTSAIVNSGLKALGKSLGKESLNTSDKALLNEVSLLNKEVNAGTKAGLTRQQILDNVLSEETGKTISKVFTPSGLNTPIPSTLKNQGLISGVVGEYKEKALKYSQEALDLAKKSRFDTDIAEKLLTDKKLPLRVQNAVGNVLGDKLAKKIIPTSLEDFGNKYSWMITSGAMEGTGSASEVMNEIQNISHEDLLENSVPYRNYYKELISQGMQEDLAKEKAKNKIAYDAALPVLFEVGALATFAGAFSKGLEKIPSGLTKAEFAKNILGEMTEEGITGFQTIPQNIAIKKYADPSKDILEGVGSNISESVIGAVPGAGIIQVPGLTKGAVKTTIKGISTAKNKAIEAYKSSSIPEKIKSKLDNKEANQELRNVSTTLFNNLSNKETVDTLNNDFKEAIINNEVLGSLSKESKELSKAVESLTIPEEDVKSEGYSSNNAIVEYQNAVSELASLLKDDPDGEHNKTKSTALKVIDLHNRLENFDNLDQINEAVSKLPDDDPNKEKLLKASEAIHTLMNNDALQSVYQYSDSVLTNITGSLQENFNILSKNKDVDQNTLNNLKSSLDTILKYKPYNLSEKTVNTILQNQDKLGLTAKQKEDLNKLNTLQGIKNTLNTSLSDNTLSAIDTETSRSKNWQTNKQEFIPTILNNLANKNITQAKNQMKKLGAWINSGLNKLDAINNTSDKSDIKFRSYDPINNKFIDVTNKGFNKSDSKDQNRINSIGSLVADAALAYNTLASLYPELGVSSIDISNINNVLFDKNIYQKYQKSLGNINTKIQESNKPKEVKIDFAKKIKRKVKSKNIIKKEEDNDSDETSGQYEIDDSEEQALREQTKENRLVTFDSNGNPVLTKPESSYTEEEKMVVNTKIRANEKFGLNSLNPFTRKLFDRVFKKKVKGITLGLDNVAKDVFNILSNRKLYDATTTANGHTNFLHKPTYTQEQLKTYKSVFNEFYKNIKERISKELDLRLIDFIEKGTLPEEYNNNLYGNLLNKIEDLRKKLRDQGVEEYILNSLYNILLDPENATDKDLENVLSNNKTRLFALVQKDEDGNLLINPHILDTVILSTFEYLISSPSQNMISDEELEEKYSGLDNEGLNELINSKFQRQILTDISRDVRDNLGLSKTLDAKDTESNLIIDSVVSEVFNVLTKDIYKTESKDYKYKKEYENRWKNLNPNFWIFEKSRITKYKDGNPNGYVEVIHFNKDNSIFKQIKNKTNGFKTMNYVISNILSETRKDNEFYMNDPVPVDKTQLHNNTPITNNEKKTIQGANEVKYYKDFFKENLLLNLGLKSLLNLFSKSIETGELPGDRNQGEFNNQDLESILGYNAQIQRELETIEYEKEVFNSITKELGISYNEVYRKYNHGITSVGRLQQKGSSTPQGSKILRMINKPTKAIIDLTNNQYRKYLDLAIAQGIGFKIHNKSYQETQEFLDNIRNNENYKNLKDLLFKYQTELPTKGIKSKSQENEANSIVTLYSDLMKSIGEAVTPTGFDAIAELVRLDHALAENNQENLKNYLTYAYIEADGITNGFIMSLIMNTLGNFTPEWEDLIAKGGIAFQGEALSKHDVMERIKSSVDDVYTSVAKETKNNILKMIKNVKNNKKNDYKDINNFNNIVTSVINVLDILDFGVNFEETKDSEGNTIVSDKKISISRAAVKDVVTQSLYFAQKETTARNIVKMLEKNLYSSISAAMQNLAKNNNDNRIKYSRQELANAFFPSENQEQNLQEFNNFCTYLNNLINNSLYIEEETGRIYITNHGKIDFYDLINSSNSLKEFSIKKTNFEKNLINNIATIYTQNVLNATHKAYSQETMDSLYSVVHAASMMTGMYRGALIRDYSSKINEVGSNGLSTRDLDEITNKNQKFRAKVSNNKKNFILEKQDYQDNNSLVSPAYASDMFGNNTINNKITLPTDGGVKPIPQLNMGLGDATMVDQVMQMFQDVLPIFDGIHMAIDKIDEEAPKINQAAMEALNNNLFRMMENRYRDFLRAFTEDEFLSTIHALESLPDNQISGDNKEDFRIKEIKDFLSSGNIEEELVNKVFKKVNKKLRLIDSKEEREKIYKDIYKQKVKSIKATIEEFKNNADSVEARSYAILNTDFSSDQMAGSENPYFHKGNEPLKQITETIDGKEVTRDETPLERLQRLYTKRFDQLQGQSVGDVNPGDVKPVRFSDLKSELSKALGGNILYQTLERNGAIGNTRLVQAKTMGSLITVANRLGVDTSTITRDNKTRAFYDPSTDIMFVLNNDFVDKKINLMHELIHAVTYKLAYQYQTDKSKLSDAQVKAFDNILELMNDFINHDLDAKDFRLSPEALYKYYDVQNKVSNLLGSGNVAQALNEFMAYGLSDPAVQEAFKITKTETSSKVSNKTMNIVMSMVPNFVTDSFKKLFKFLKEFLFGTDKISLNTSYFSQLQANTAIIINKQFNSNTTGLTSIESPILFRTDPIEENDRLANLRESLVTQLQTKVDLNKVGDFKLNNAKDFIALNQGKLAATSLTTYAAFPEWNAQQREMFNMLAATMVTANGINQKSLALIKDFQSLVQKKLSYEDLYSKVEDPNGLAAKYDVLMGINKDIPKEMHLAAFMGILAVDPELREIVGNLDNKIEAKSKGNFDTKLQTYFKNLFYTMTQASAGTLNEKSVTDALDKLANHLIVEAKTPFTLDADTTAKANEITNQVMNTVVEKAQEGLYKAADKATTKLGKNIATIGGSVIEPLKNGHGEVFFDTLNVQIHKLKWVPQSVKDMISDLVGLTNRNADAYNLIKPIRYMVQRTRNEFINNFPVILRNKFKNKPSKKEMKTLTKVLGSVDLSAFGIEADKNLDLIDNHSYRKAIKANLLKTIKENSTDIAMFNLYQQKCEELATFMVTGRNESNLLLRNAEAIAYLRGYNYNLEVKSELITALDQLTSIYAIEKSNASEKAVLSKYIASDFDAIVHITSALYNIAQEEKQKAQGNAKWNYQKGYLPAIKKSSGSIVIADSTKEAYLLSHGYKKVAKYNSNAAESNKNINYYYSSLTPPQFNEGIIQIVNQTAGGVDISSGFSTGYTGGLITKPEDVKRITRFIQRDIVNKNIPHTEKYVPVFNEDGDIVAYERSVDPTVINNYGKFNRDITDMIGRQLGRQAEERIAKEINKKSIDVLHDMYNKADSFTRNSFVNVFELAKTDPTIESTLKLLTPEIKEYIFDSFGENKFYVPVDLVEDVIGSKMASVTDIYTGNTRYNSEVQKAIKIALVATLGNNGYRWLKTIEQWDMAMMSYARNTIVVKSVVVPAVNAISNVIQLMIAGVPLTAIIKGIPQKTAELEHYFDTQREIMKLQADIFATTDEYQKGLLEARIETLRNSYQGMQTIRPLIEQGEMSTVADLGIKPDEVEISDGQLGQWFEEKLGELPEPLNTLSRTLAVTKDTTLYQALEKSIQYGDFVAKSILYDDLINRRGWTREAAMRRIKEEFVDYDKFRGRQRQYLESIGLMWFYDYKIRSVKVAASLLKYNPFGALIGSMIPAFVPFNAIGLSGIGTAITDNLVSKAWEGGLGNTMGFDMFFRSLTMNPFIALFRHLVN